MDIYLLDTSILSMLEFSNEKIVAALEKHLGQEVVVCSEIVIELLGGWYNMLARAKSRQTQAKAHASLADATGILQRFEVYPLTEASLLRADELVKSKINVRKADLKIAALALELDATVVTNNIRDFSRVPGLKVEDWSV
jgi:tRNA(fMet)-specific endonuclease VapC